MRKSFNCDIKEKEGVVFISFPIFEKTGIVKQGFSTRLGGVSEGRYSSMNLSYTNGDKKENVDKNFELICRALEISPESIVKSHQTHTVNIKNIDSAEDSDFTDIDALITDKRGITLCCSFADCVPILFLDPEKRVIASAHSGWRGTCGEIGRLTVERMASDYGCSPKNILAAIGPAICKDCYEVDEPVARELRKIEGISLEGALIPSREGHYKLDLKEICRRILLKAGIMEENILVSDICTCCESEWLHSHRATGGERGNLCSFLQLN